MGGRKRIALLDCIECFQYAIDDPHKSLGILRKFDAIKFDTQKEDPATWLSVALTDEDTSWDGFEDQDSKQVKKLQNQVSRVTSPVMHRLLLTN
ncbi:hypothetical protein NC651_006921 [Populus alba x Populus x berolinensis]|nr:hypothetical protein NC651_006921 [Populus alba x Populus x berolinensis]